MGATLKKQQENDSYVCLTVGAPCAMADQLSPDEKFHLITRNLQVGHADSCPR